MRRWRRPPHSQGRSRCPRRSCASPPELSQVLSGIRLTRETIQSYSVERLRDTHDRLSEVTSTTETAAMQMLNGLDRTLAMIDELERSSEGGPRTRRATRFGRR